MCNIFHKILFHREINAFALTDYLYTFRANYGWHLKCFPIKINFDDFCTTLLNNIKHK